MISLNLEPTTTVLATCRLRRYLKAMKNWMPSLLLLICIGSVCAADSGMVKGQIAIGKGLSAPKGVVLFIAARPIAGGPPLAVKRIKDPQFPLEFTLGQENAMMGGAFTGEVEITVRASQTGDAMARTPGDLVGTAKTKVGATDVMIKLDHKI